MSMKKLLRLLPGILLVSTSAAATAEPWRLANLNLTPDWLSISGQHRSRYETLNNQYRANRSGGDQALLFRTNVKAELDFETIRLGLEMMDSRAALADAGTPLTTTEVNPLELLQAYVDIPVENLFIDNSKASLKAGRLTMDIGSRRFVARNRYRNTINAFTGVDFQWQDASQQQFRAFFTFPIQRRVHGNILDNDARFDKEHSEVRFWGAYYAPSTLPWGKRNKGEIYFLGLNEKDVPGEWATRNRDLYTLVTRLYSTPKVESYYYDVESAIQFGESRSSTTATTDLNHVAYFVHLEAGYNFNASWNPQLLFQYDFASGDEALNDDDNNRFDTLYGARRFEFGPTSIYGAFARSNLSSPGLRLKLEPGKTITSFIALRGYWLASDSDSWTTARISNVGSQSDSYIGTQVEARIRWDVVPKNVRLETGAALLFAGDLMNNTGKTDTSYFYSQLVLSF